MPVTTSRDGTSIGYDRIGCGPLVLLVNGAMGYREHHSDRPLAELLSASYTVVCYDRRGRGQSTDTTPYDVEREIEDIEQMRRSPDWQTVERVAPTLAYDNAVLGDGTVPHTHARTVAVPTLVVGSEVMPFTVEAAEALTNDIPNAVLQILEQPSPEVIAPALAGFFGRDDAEAAR